MHNSLPYDSTNSLGSSFDQLTLGSSSSFSQSYEVNDQFYHEEQLTILLQQREFIKSQIGLNKNLLEIQQTINTRSFSINHIDRNFKTFLDYACDEQSIHMILNYALAYIFSNSLMFQHISGKSDPICISKKRLFIFCHKLLVKKIKSRTIIQMELSFSR